MMNSFPPIIFALLISVVGMPHGGLDHRYGRILLRPRFQSSWCLVFLAAYLGVGAIVIAGWFNLPAITAVMFFLLSAWHFGDHLRDQQPFKIIEGGMVIWIPLLIRPTEVAEILAWVIPNGNIENVRAGLSVAQPCLWVILVLFLISLPAERSAETAGRKVAFALLFALLPTLVSFTLYFCGWHSIRELAALAKQADSVRPWRGLRRVLLVAAPMALLTVAAITLLALLFAGARAINPVIVQAVFLGLSTVAVPHILLQEVVRQLDINPFEPEADL